MNNFKLDDSYIDVAKRITEFRKQYPTGSLQPADPAKPYTVETIADQTYIIYVAAAYRSPDDIRPGIGMAQEIFPGRTSFTRGSELQNAETSAWGRAIVAALAADTKRGIASAQEVRGRDAPAESVDPLMQARAELSKVLRNTGREFDEAEAKFAADGHGELRPSTNVAEIGALTAHYRKMAGGEP